jgi:hypothetical protein
MTSFAHEKTWQVADQLLEVAKADTAFADMYLQRARALLAPDLSESQFEALEALDREVASLTSRIAAAVEERDWERVRDLTSRGAELRRAVSSDAAIRPVAARVYGAVDQLLVDPFSPGISGIAGVAERDLPSLRDGAVKRLARLRAVDSAWADLYEARRRALAELRLGAASSAAEDAESSEAALVARLQKALADGNFAQLHEVSRQLVGAEQRAPTAGAGPTPGFGGLGLTPPALARAFTGDVRGRAARFALAPHRLESMFEQLSARFPLSWSPTPADASGNTMRFKIGVPGDTDEALRDALALFANRAVLTSGGTRYFPWFVEEDVLVEDFDEGGLAAADVASPLLEALGLSRRGGLSRNRIERALRERGAAVVEDIGLDPRDYRLVCIPPDVYTRLGSKLGWGQREIWTHFDGYVATNERKLLSLVGGDVRFGGLHDLVTVSGDYDSDRLFARFAVVQRKRLTPW